MTSSIFKGVNMQAPQVAVQLNEQTKKLSEICTARLDAIDPSAGFAAISKTTERSNLTGPWFMNHRFEAKQQLQIAGKAAGKTAGKAAIAEQNYSSPVPR